LTKPFAHTPTNLNKNKNPVILSEAKDLAFALAPAFVFIPVILSEAKDLVFCRHHRNPQREKENSVILSEVSANVAPPLAQQTMQPRVEGPAFLSSIFEHAALAPAPLKGHGFSRAAEPPGQRRALALEGRLLAKLIALLFFFVSPAIPQDSQPPTFHVKVHLVNVFVNVTNPNGGPVGGLTQDDFTLTEDGVPQKISYFERDTNMPLSLILAIDTSGSVRKDTDIELRAARDFLRALLRPIDRIDLIDFNSSAREVVPFTSDLRHLEWGLNNLDYGPATALYDTIYLSSQMLGERPGRKALIVISDGGNTVKDIDYQQALDRAIRGEVMVYSLIDLPILNDAGRDTGGEHALITLSQETGGKYFYAQFGDISGAFQKISEDLRTQYVISYYPVQRRSQSDFRRIQVTLRSNPSDTLRYRPGYYATPSPPLDQ
jgi:Ca-activated chloride channel homolog